MRAVCSIGRMLGALALLGAGLPCHAGLLSASLASIPQGSNVNLTVLGSLDWVHWGLHTETSANRKAGVLNRIGNYTLLDSPTGYAYVWQYADNYN
jgi:hypothetical protein